MPKEKESFSEQLRIRRAKEERKKMNLQERIEFLKDEKKEKLEKIGIKEKNKLEDKLRLGIVADINNNGVNVLKFNNGERQFLSLFNYREKMIKKIEDLKRCQIVCKNIQQVENCLNMLKELGFRASFDDAEKEHLIIHYSDEFKRFWGCFMLEEEKYIEFYNKKLIKTLQKLIKEKKEEDEKKEKEEVKDFEIAEDGRIIKVNNKQSEKEIFVVYDGAYNYDCEYYTENATKIVDMAQNYLDFIVKYGLIYATKEARDRAKFKLEIETKLKNIAERLNKGQKIYWENRGQYKFKIYYDYFFKSLRCDCLISEKEQGAICCLDKNFLNIAIQEIGEDNLIKYFKE